MPIFAYTWLSDSQSGNFATTNSEPMVVSDVVAGNPSAATAAAAAYSAIAGKSEGRRGLLLRKVGLARSDCDLISAGVSAMALVEGGLNVSSWRAWMADYWRTWKASGSAEPDDIIIDLEDHEVPFELTVSPSTSALVAELTAHPILKYRLHPTLRGLSAAELTAGYPNNVITGAWDTVRREAMARALRAIVCSTYQNVIGSACPRTTNYTFGSRRETTYSDFNRPYLGESTALTGQSSPVPYIQATNPGSGRFAGTSKARRYNGFIDAINHVRAFNDPGIPWVSRWAYNGEGVSAATNIAGWTELMKHLGRMGVSKVIQWSYGSTSPDDIDSHEAVFAAVSVSAVTAGTRYPQIALDAASVTTNGYTTTYSAGDWT